jgi:steroid delta-isomerase-like uncharacterized protein
MTADRLEATRAATNRGIVPMSTESSKAVVQRFRDALNVGDLDGAFAVLAPNAVVHMQSALEPLTREDFKQLGQAMLSAFTDGMATVEDMIADGDTVVSRLMFRGIHTGDLMGIPPTGKSVAIAETTIDRIADGRIVESWRLFDQMTMMQQLGVLPAPGHS